MLQEADYVAFFIKLPVFECDKIINECLHLFLKKYISLFLADDMTDDMTNTNTEAAN